MAPSVSQDVRVPKHLHGKIVGSRGATIRDIESDYPGVKVRVPQRNDPSDAIHLEGPADAVKRAEHRVLDIAGVLGDEAAHERKKADELRTEKDRLFDEANHVHDLNKRRVLLDQAHAKKRQLDAEEHAAAKRIFRKKNSGYGLEQMDLHGLHVDEAMEQVKERLRRLEAGEVPDGTVEIITGAGHHSEQHKAKIRPAVEAELRKRPALTVTPLAGGGGFKVFKSGAVEGAEKESGRGFFGGLLSMLTSWFCGVRR